MEGAIRSLFLQMKGTKLN